MYLKRLYILLLVGVFCLPSLKLYSLTIKDIEENSYSEIYCVGQDGSRYYFWSGASGGPQIKLDYARTPNIDDIVGYYVSKFSSSGELKYSTKLPFKGILFGDIKFRILEENKDSAFLLVTGASAEAFNYFYAFDSLGNIVWKSDAKLPSFCCPAGIFRRDDGTVLYFGKVPRYFKVFHFDWNGRKEVQILDSFIDYSKQLLGLPSIRDWRVARLGNDCFLVVGFKSSLNRDILRGTKTIGDYIHIFSFLVNSEGEMLDSICLDNAEGNAAIVPVNRNSIGTTGKGFFDNFDYFRMPDSSLIFVFGVWPRWKEKEWQEANFPLYIVKFTKDGKLVPLTSKPKVLPLTSLPYGYRIKGFAYRVSPTREFWDYAVDSLGNFYVEIRKYSFKRK